MSKATWSERGDVVTVHRAGSIDARIQEIESMTGQAPSSAVRKILGYAETVANGDANTPPDYRAAARLEMQAFDLARKEAQAMRDSVQSPKPSLGALGKKP